jgi:hypothetical protein
VILTCTTPIGKHPLDFSVRWVGEFENKNRVEGDTFVINTTCKF